MQVSDCRREWCAYSGVHLCPYYDEHGVFYDDDPTVDHEEPCPDYITRDDIAENQGCDKYHSMVEGE
jgi:hypothetical protein